jgi:hypothetical protein
MKRFLGTTTSPLHPTADPDQEREVDLLRRRVAELEAGLKKPAPKKRTPMRRRIRPKP